MAGVDDWGALRPGNRVAGYEIRRKLGQGGFGIAYEGFNPDLRLRAAIKEFFPRDFVGRSGTAVSVREEGQEEFYQRFLNRFIDEARAVHRLNHPNIVKVRHFERANNTAYVVMDYIDGAPLKDWLGAHRGKLAEADLRAVFEPVMDALGYVHDHDMLHRDVSPANIMVDVDGKPWLIDFGAFKEMWKDQPRRTTVQAANPAYAAPEQLDEMAGQGHGPFTDIFALSAALYEAIAGKKPSSAMSRTVSLISGRTDSLEPLAQTAAVRCNPTVVAAVMKGLTLSPASRPQSIAEMRAAMSWVKGATTVAWREPPRMPRAPPPSPTTPPSPHVEEVNRTALQLNPSLGKQRSASIPPQAGNEERRHRSRGGLAIGLVAGLAVVGALGVFGYKQYSAEKTDKAVAISTAPRTPATTPKPQQVQREPEEPFPATSPRKVATVPISRTGEPLTALPKPQQEPNAPKTPIETTPPRKVATVPIVKEAPAERVNPQKVPGIIIQESKAPEQQTETPPPPAPKEPEPRAPLPRVPGLIVQRPPVKEDSPPTATKTPPISKVPESTSTTSGYVAVLTSRKSRADALAAWGDIQQKYPDVLSSKQPDVQSADNGTGHWERLVVGPPMSKEAAMGVCSKLAEAGFKGCWVKPY